MRNIILRIGPIRQERGHHRRTKSEYAENFVRGSWSGRELVDWQGCFLLQSSRAMRHVSEQQLSCEMKVAPLLSHEIRYVSSVHGGILTSGVAILHGNVFLMATLRLGSDRPRAQRSVKQSRHNFPPMVIEPRCDCLAWSRDRRTQPRPLLQKVGHRFEERSRANPRRGVDRRFVPASCCVSGGVAVLDTLRSAQLSSGTASGLLRRPAARRSSASNGP